MTSTDEKVHIKLKRYKGDIINIGTPWLNGSEKKMYSWAVLSLL